MATRRPLVNVSGALQELPVGDTLAGASGASPTSGTATLNFGTGANETSVTVTGQTGIVSGSAVWLAVLSDSTSANHTANDHKYAARFIGLSADTPISNTGFTIYGVSEHKLSGQFTVTWHWV